MQNLPLSHTLSFSVTHVRSLSLTFPLFSHSLHFSFSFLNTYTHAISTCLSCTLSHTRSLSLSHSISSRTHAFLCYTNHVYRSGCLFFSLGQYQIRYNCLCLCVSFLNTYLHANSTSLSHTLFLSHTLSPTFGLSLNFPLFSHSLPAFLCYTDHVYRSGCLFFSYHCLCLCFFFSLLNTHTHMQTIPLSHTLFFSLTYSLSHSHFLLLFRSRTQRHFLSVSSCLFSCRANLCIRFSIFSLYASLTLSLSFTLPLSFSISYHLHSAGTEWGEGGKKTKKGLYNFVC